MRSFRTHSEAFSLVELLVSIGVIALLIGLLVPALSQAKSSAKTARELAAGQQLMLAYTLYADDAKGQLLPGYPPDSWVSATPTVGTPSLTVLDDVGRPITGTLARRYPWRIVPYMEYNFFGLYKDERVLLDYRAKSADQYQYLVSLSPSFGLNSTFVGGDANKNGFNKYALANYGPFYATRNDQPQRPSSLITFASSKGPGVDGDTTEGFFRVDSPYVRTRQWSATPTWNTPGASPEGYGQVSYRHQGKAAVMNFDSHAELLTYDRLDDMRRWANGATDKTWTLDQK